MKFIKNRIFLVLLSLLTISILETNAQSKAYKGGELSGKTAYDFQYGKIEFRMKAAKGGGILSTYYLWKDQSGLSTVSWEEVDVEIFGKNNATTWQTNIITGLDELEYSEQVHSEDFSLADDFHTYTLEWTPDYISWSIDDKEVRKTIGAPATDISSPSGIRLNLWVATSEEWAGVWDDSVLPQYQFVNWIKYYKYEDGEFIYDWTEDFDTFNSSRWSKADWTFDGNRVDFVPDNVVLKDGMLILCLTKDGELGYSGEVPVDSADLVSTVVTNNVIADESLLGQDKIIQTHLIQQQ
jgi:beta-glucanase (GH16 family)